MNRAAILEWESRWALPAALTAFAAAALFVAGTVVSAQGVGSTDTESQFLREFNDNSGTLLLGAVLLALALAAFAGPLYYLFKADAARSSAVRRGLVGIVIAGPLFLGAAKILQWIALDAAATDFATPVGGFDVPASEYAEDLITGQTTFSIAQGLTFAGIIGFVTGTIYTALWAMRVGLVTRFFGTLGMALGASLVLLAPEYSQLALMVWVVWLGLIFVDRVPGDRPPAWDEGDAVPWPKPGEEPDEPDRHDEPGDVIDGLAAETTDGENPNVARRQRAKRRKRKRRG
jgi:hypothetical protein